MTQAAQQLISIDVLHMINGDYELYGTGFNPSNTYALPYHSHTYQAVSHCYPWLYPHWPCNDEIMKMEIKNVFPVADTRNECRQERRICIWKLSIINVVITTTTTATATTTIFLLVVDYTVKINSVPPGIISPFISCSLWISHHLMLTSLLVAAYK